MGKTRTNLAWSRPPLPVIVSHDAALDVIEAQAWYEAQRVGLGQRFALVFQDRVRQIGKMPLSFRAAQKGARRALMSPFPFKIMFRVEPTFIKIVAVFHTARGKQTWMSRLP